MRILRPYQEECVQAVGSCLSAGHRRILYVMATGTGKTLVFADIVRRVLGTAEGARVLVLAHRQELISQGYQSVQEHCGLDEWEVQVEMERYRAGAAARVVIGSVQTVMNPARLEGWQPHVIICDESHRASAKAQYADVFARFGVPDRCILVGCTATAKRTDRKSLYARHSDGSPVVLKGKAGEVEATNADCAFDVLAYDYGLLPAVEDGWLVPIIGHSRPTVTNLNGIKTANGDFEVGKLSHTIDNNARTNVAINAWRDIAVDRPTLAFCATVEHAHHSAELWRQAGYKAVALDGETERGERQDAFRDFKAGRIQVICNVGIASEGTDLPTCSCIVSLRPTKSWLLKVQQCLDGETEVLTSHGWKGMGHIKEGDCVPSIDMETGKGCWGRVEEYIERDMEKHEGWIEHHAPRADFRVTGQHNMIVSTASGRAKNRSPWRMEQATRLPCLERSSLHMLTAVQIDQVGVPLTDAELYFIGMMMTDGTWTEQQAMLFQSERYPGVMERIEKCLSDCGFTWRKRIDNCPSVFKSGFTRWRYVISAGKTRAATRMVPPYLRGAARERDPREDWHQGHTGFRHLMPFLDKDFAPSLMALSRKQFLTLIRSIHDGDGTKLASADYTPQGWQFCSARKLFTDRIQALAAINGCTASLAAEQGARTNAIYYLTITPKDWRSIGGYGDTRPHVEGKPSTTERVWCIRTETGTIITRRRGKVTVMGNCGRGTRPLDGLLDSLQMATPAERQAAIAGSAKATCIVLDLVDLYDKPGELCTVPAILDLPAQLNLEGRSLTAAKKMLDQFEEVRERVIGECPMTFTELQVRLEQVDLMRNSGARTVRSWMATEEGYRYTKVPIGYQCDLVPEADSYRLVVRNGGQVLAEKLGKPAFGMKDYLDKAASRARDAIDLHRAAQPPKVRGTLGRLTERQVKCLTANGHTRAEIDTWPYAKARAIIAKYMEAWNARSI